jgi:rsbT co-antagonist protein RsbR
MGERSPTGGANALSALIRTHGDEILSAWLAAQTVQAGVVSEGEMRQQCRLLLDDLAQLSTDDWDDPSYAPLKGHLADLSRAYALRKAKPNETATFVFALKDAASETLRAVTSDPEELWRSGEAINRHIDRLGLYTFDTFVASREEMIREQQRTILELSTPVVQVWERILALPIVGTVDTLRTQQIMEDLLQKIVETGAEVVLLDITGVPVVDTSVARHLIQTGTAARLLGAEVILVGISPRIAQTLVHLGVDLGEVTTRASLAKGLEVALSLTHRQVVPL